ncbi:MAG: hypothetical protein HN704_14555 [Bacteroidetes bacterium]|jgi:hypothetical protein|nr:hypothetical protein [Bacteroidota bacterium]MBT6686942.1 hypothetical protein [Bacteroidota bacterium]MBT7143204.1 hypothetical protein [Bacteroidota bacterium]MBT7492818.1 hypothetical protein [Bacteroidota bacterium]
MKIVSDVLENIAGIQTYYIVGMLIFLFLFIVIVVRTYSTPNSEMSNRKNAIFDEKELLDIKNDK